MTVHFIEIKNFRLKYDGIFSVEFKYKEVEYIVEVYLPLDMFIKMLKNEGILWNISDYDTYNEGLVFKNSTIVFEVAEDYDEIMGFIISKETEQFEKYGLNTFIYKCFLKETA